MSQPTPETLEEYKKAQQEEWGRYVATENIDLDGVRAFNEGHAVPASHVERGIVSKEQVRAVPKAEAARTQTAIHTPAEKKES